MNAIVQAMIRNAVGLAIFAAVTAGAIGITKMLTQDRIQQQETRARYAALKDVMPDSRYTNTLGSDTIELPRNDELGTEPGDTAFVARKEGRVSGVILPLTAPDGYSGDIELLVGIDRQGRTTGVRVTNHSETPGLGDAIEADKSDWILDFNGHSLDNPPPDGWRVSSDGGEFDTLSGATITSRAVVRAVYRGLVFFNNNRNDLLKEGFSEVE